MAGLGLQGHLADSGLGFLLGSGVGGVGFASKCPKCQFSPSVCMSYQQLSSPRSTSDRVPFRSRSLSEQIHVSCVGAYSPGGTAS